MTEDEYKDLATCIALGIKQNAGNDAIVISLLSLKKKVFDSLRELEELKKEPEK